MHGCNIFTCHKSYVGWHVGSHWNSSDNPTTWWPDLNVQLQLLALCYQAIQLSWHHHDVFEHLTAHYFLSQRHFLLQSSISCFVCNLYIFLLGKECKVQKLRPRQELNSQPSNLNSGALSTELWGLSVLREFYLYLNFCVFCKLLLEMLVNFGLVLRYKMEKNDLMLQLVNVKLLSCMPAFI